VAHPAQVPLLDANMIRDLHDTRLTGNWSLHDGVTFDADEVADVAAMVEEAVEVIYVQSARRASLAAKRTARRQGQLGKCRPAERERSGNKRRSRGS
jgi:hypothetical protein